MSEPVWFPREEGDGWRGVWGGGVCQKHAWLVHSPVILFLLHFIWDPYQALMIFVLCAKAEHRNEICTFGWEELFKFSETGGVFWEILEPTGHFAYFKFLHY